MVKESLKRRPTVSGVPLGDFGQPVAG